MYVSLQVARGFAASAVAAFHLSIAMGDPKFGGDGTRVLWTWFSKGNLGVDFFFVLSGFIILLVHQSDIDCPASFRRYATRRAIRIYPIYWIYLSAAIAGMLLVGSSYFQLATASDWLTAYGLVRVSDVAIPLGQAWTLFHEMVFYAMFSLLILNRTLGIWTMAIWFGASALYLYYPASSDQRFIDTILAGYNLNFLIGMVACVVARRYVSLHAWAATLAGVGLLVFAYFVEHSQGGRSGGLPLMYAIGFGVLVSGFTALERLGAWHPPALLALVGDASYSIYLLHEHTQNYTLRALNKINVLDHVSRHTVFWLVFAVTILGGCLAYVVIERPLLRKLRDRLEVRAQHVPMRVAPT